MESIEAKIFAPITTQYTKEEIANMPTHQASRVEIMGLLKVTGEEHLTTLKSANSDDIRKQVIELCEQYHPRPLCVILNTTLNRTFLVDKRYYENDHNIIYELITFSYGPQSEEVLKFFNSKNLELGEILRSKYGIDPYDIPYVNKWKGREALFAELMRFISHNTESIYSEAESRFGLRQGRFKKFTIKTSTGDEFGTYTTTSEIAAREQGGKHANTALDECVEEKSRFFQKGLPPTAVEYYENYHRKVHPEIIGPFGIGNIKLRSSEG